GSRPPPGLRKPVAWSTTGPARSLYRPRLLLPDHLPEHPFIARANNEDFFQAPAFLIACGLGPAVHSLAHPAADRCKFRRGVQHQPITVRMRFGRRPFPQQMLADDTINPRAG